MARLGPPVLAPTAIDAFTATAARDPVALGLCIGDRADDLARPHRVVPARPESRRLVQPRRG
jgi:hypothetical protein